MSNTKGATQGVETTYPPQYLSSLPVFSGVGVFQY